MSEKPGWTTTLQQDFAGARKAVEDLLGGKSTKTIVVKKEEVEAILNRLDDMERKLQVARCNAIGSLEAL